MKISNFKIPSTTLTPTREEEPVKKLAKNQGSNLKIDKTNNKDKAKEIGRKGKDLVEEFYNWENESKKLVNFYKNIVLQ